MGADSRRPDMLPTIWVNHHRTVFWPSIYVSSPWPIARFLTGRAVRWTPALFRFQHTVRWWFTHIVGSISGRPESAPICRSYPAERGNPARGLRLEIREHSESYDRAGRTKGLQNASCLPPSAMVSIRDDGFLGIGHSR